MQQQQHHTKRLRRDHVQNVEPALITLKAACRIAGISIERALKLPPEQFVPWQWLGGRRVVGRRRFLRWVAEMAGEDAAS